ncbi:MAG: helix-turn-helix transcriptional regulator [Bacteroidetes bacterium]|nr:helix-turn-helix transcriptional regulator [Bacteroidota bacterium]
MFSTLTSVAVTPQPTTKDGRSRTARRKHRLGWLKFEEQFRQRHPHFLGELARLFPTLSRTELEICAMLFEAMPSWQIAEVLSITERSVENHRSNIRRKFSLTPSQHLHSFLLGVIGATQEMIIPQS